MKVNQEKLERDAEYQRRKSMSQDDRNRIAIDIGARNIHEQNQREGKNTTFEEAHKKAIDIAHKQLRKKQEND